MAQDKGHSALEIEICQVNVSKTQCVILGSYQHFFNSAACTMLFTTMTINEPLFLFSDYSIMTPNKHYELSIDSGTKFKVDCGAGNVFQTTDIQQHEFECRNQMYYNLLDSKTPLTTLSHLKCTKSENKEIKKLEAVTVRKTTISCGNEAKIYHIGINVAKNGEQLYIPVLESCFDKTFATVLYVKSNIYGKIRRPGGSARHSINNGNWDDQSRISSTVFLIDSISDAYTDNNFNKGHLAPNADYDFSLFRKATSIYLNMAPMDPDFNQKNWGALEAGVRDYIKTNEYDATIYTGGFVMGTVHTLANANNNIIPGHQHTAVKIPDLFWKIIIADGKGIAIYKLTKDIGNFPHCPLRGTTYYCNVKTFYDKFRRYMYFTWPNEIIKYDETERLEMD